MNGCRSALLVVVVLAGCGPAEVIRPTRDANPPPPTVSNEQMVAGRPLSAWVKELQSKDANERRYAVLTLGNKGATYATPHLLTALKDPDPGVRAAAVRALRTVGKDAKTTLPALIVALKDEDDEVKGHATDALSDYRSEAKAAVPQLVEIVKITVNNKLRAQAGRALIHIDSDAAQKAGVELPQGN